MQTKKAILIFVVCLVVIVGIIAASKNLRRSDIPTDWQSQTWTTQKVPHTTPIVKEKENVFEVAKRTNKKILLFFTAESCSYCKKMSTEMRPNMKPILEQYVFSSIDADKRSDIARKYGVNLIPAYRMLDSDGKLYKSGDGYMAQKDFMLWLDIRERRTLLRR